MTDLAHWKPRPRPQRVTLEGRYVRLEPLSALRHGDDLYRAATEGNADDRFRWLFETTPPDRASFGVWLQKAEASEDPLYFTVVDMKTGEALGRQTLMRIEPAHGVIEIGNIHWGPNMQRSRLATEAQYLFSRHVFEDLGYRRYEWKCNDRNEPSKTAALRFGFTFEGVFRQHLVVKGENRDTAWYSIIDGEWPVLRKAFEDWLDPPNFDADGRQRLRLSALTARAIGANGIDFLRIGPEARTLVETIQAQAYARVLDAIGVVPTPLLWDYGVILDECEAWLAPRGEGLLILRRGAEDLYVESIATLPAACGTGLGGALMQAAFGRARALDLPKVRLMTNARNPALAWYKRLGFVVEREEDMGDRVAVHMVATVA
ncbi:MAG: GNAT family N-acetyltransferase [Rhizobiaceae bacterium]|nr:GNAT family N-acetyltransferase [Rhizobiaceae bacterium]MCV0406948.1 GNAT family N-acetyltransferase [Rhizobiaceae bacterium]